MVSQLYAEALLQVLADERLHMPDTPEESIPYWRNKLKRWGATVSDELDASVTRQVVHADASKVHLFIAICTHAVPHLKGF